MKVTLSGSVGQFKLVYETGLNATDQIVEWRMNDYRVTISANGTVPLLFVESGTEEDPGTDVARFGVDGKQRLTRMLKSLPWIAAHLADGLPQLRQFMHDHPDSKFLEVNAGIKCDRPVYLSASQLGILEKCNGLAEVVYAQSPKV